MQDAGGEYGLRNSPIRSINSRLKDFLAVTGKERNLTKRRR